MTLACSPPKISDPFTSGVTSTHPSGCQSDTDDQQGSGSVSKTDDCIISRAYGSLKKFQSRKGLLNAFHDIISTYRTLQSSLQSSSPPLEERSIVVDYYGTAGSCGAFISLDLSDSYAGCDTPDPTKLRTETSSMSVDIPYDLGWFLNLLNSICFRYDRPGHLLKPEPRICQDSVPYLRNRLGAEVSDWFGQEVQDMLQSLHDFCRKEHFKTMLHGTQPLSVKHKTERLGVFLGYIESTLEKLEAVGNDPVPPSPIGCSTMDYKALWAVYDAVAQHRFLRVKKKILYRDVTTRSILIGDWSDLGNRGKLADIDLAMSSEGCDGYFYNKDYRTDDITFLSVSTLMHSPPDHLDLLESFFYVLYWLFCRDNWSGIQSVAFWTSPDRSREDKHRFLVDPMRPLMVGWLSSHVPFIDMCEALHTFCGRYYLEKERHYSKWWDGPIVWTEEQVASHYDEFLDIIAFTLWRMDEQSPKPSI